MRRFAFATLVVMVVWIGVSSADVELKNYNYELGAFVTPETDLIVYSDTCLKVKGTKEALSIYFDRLEAEVQTESKFELIQFLKANLDHLEPNEKAFIQPLQSPSAKAKDWHSTPLCEDTYVWENNPTTNYGAEAVVLSGCSDDGRMWGLLGTYECPGETVTDALLGINIVGDTLDQQQGYIGGCADDAWDEYVVTWDTSPDILLLSYVGFGINPGTTGYIYMGDGFTCVDHVCNDGNPNYGFLLVGGFAYEENACLGIGDEYIAIEAKDEDGSCDGDESILWMDYTVDVSLSDFIAIAGDELVKIRWATSYEKNNAGWNIYRAEGKSSEYVKINDPIIAPYQYSYEYVDADARGGRSGRLDRPLRACLRDAERGIGC